MECLALDFSPLMKTPEGILNLGGKKVVTGNDGFRLDRDLNGARGIWIKSVVEISLPHWEIPPQ